MYKSMGLECRGSSLVVVKLDQHENNFYMYMYCKTLQLTYIHTLNRKKQISSAFFVQALSIEMFYHHLPDIALQHPHNGLPPRIL
jgi:hypothetical protein